MLTKDEQIKALLTGRAFELATHTLGCSRMTSHSYSEVFTVSRPDIDDYVQRYGIPMDRVSTADDHSEGIHFVRRGSTWVLYWQERGARYDEHEFTDEATAQRTLVDSLLNTSGTGIRYA